MPRDAIHEQRLRDILRREVEYVGPRRMERRVKYLIAALCCFGLAACVAVAYGLL